MMNQAIRDSRKWHDSAAASAEINFGNVLIDAESGSDVSYNGEGGSRDTFPSAGIQGANSSAKSAQSKARGLHGLQGVELGSLGKQRGYVL